MCGILGYYDREYDRECDRETNRANDCDAVHQNRADKLKERLRDGAEAIRHRGPNETQFWIEAEHRVGFAHNRLAIVDLRRGQHPVKNEDGTIIAIVNGEFYEDDRHRAELKRAGHRFSGGTDSEILVHLYEQYGVSCVEHLRGEFAFVLWDQRRKRLLAARDRFGIKPLVYHPGNDRRGNELWLASEAKALFAAGIDAEWDHQAAAQALSHQYLAPSSTLFRGVRQLPPGHLMIAQRGDIEIRSYWDLDLPKTTSREPKTDAQAAAEIREELERAITLRLRADVSVGCYLSGGLDSSSILALANQNNPHPLPAFSIAFEDARYDEHLEASRFAMSLGSDFHPVTVSQRDLLDHLPSAVRFSEGLCINGQLVAKYLLSREAQRSGVAVVLVGEGADEVFGGYAHLQHDFLSAQPNSAAALAKLAEQYPLQRGVMLPGSRNPDGAQLEHAFEPLGGQVPSFLRAKFSIGTRLRGLLNHDTSELVKEATPAALLEQLAATDQLVGRASTDQSTFLWTKLALAGYILKTLGDGTEMAHSIEGRVPFLDHRLFEIARNHAPKQKFRDGSAKNLLRLALDGVLPEEIRRRPKRPLLAPPVSATTDPKLKDSVRDVLTSSEFSAIPFFDRRKVGAWLDELWKSPPSKRSAAEPVLMTMLSAAALQGQFKLGEGHESKGVR